MNELFPFEWRRDPEGYEIRKTKNGDSILTPKSDDRFSYRPFEIEIGRQVLFQIFADTQLSPDAYRDFANRFGLLYTEGDDELLSEWNLAIKRMRRAIEDWRSGKLISAIDEFNQNYFGDSQFRVLLEHGPNIGDSPRLCVRPKNLYAALWIQFANAVSTDMQIRHCNFCRTPFAYGSGTNRRSTAKYCTIKCQQAHSYRKRLESEK